MLYVFELFRRHYIIFYLTFYYLSDIISIGRNDNFVSVNVD